ncbi:MAG: EthD domain-containing protein [Acidimicrobiia bacterium]
MIKLIALVKRNPALSREEFHRHWREHHGPLIRDSEAANRYVLRYEQNHRLDDDYERDGTGIGDAGFDGQSFDGLAVQWFRSVDDFWAMVADPDYQAEVGPDEQHMLDFAATVFLLTDEEETFIQPVRIQDR